MGRTGAAGLGGAGEACRGTGGLVRSGSYDGLERKGLCRRPGGQRDPQEVTKEEIQERERERDRTERAGMKTSSCMNDEVIRQ